MPELPEVETVVRGLQKSVLGRKILSVWIGKSDFIDNPGEFTSLERTENRGDRAIRQVHAVATDERRRSAAAEAETVVAVAESAASRERKAVCGVAAGASRDDGADRADSLQKFRSRSTRMFRSRSMMGESFATPMRGVSGAWRISRQTCSRKKLREPAPIRSKWAPPNSPSAFVRAIRGSRRCCSIKRVFRGVGNIYADESLWRAKIHPARVGAKLSEKEAQTLRRVLQEILNRAIVMRGSSISDFLDANGEPGEYQRHHRAYGREGKPCYRCRTPIRRVIVAGRSSYFCPKCQPAPRQRKSKRRKPSG